MKDYEDLQKKVMRLARVADKAKIGAKTLDDKVAMVQMEKDFRKILDILRMNHFKYEDAIVFSKNTDKCIECGAIHAAD